MGTSLPHFPMRSQAPWPRLPSRSCHHPLSSASISELVEPPGVSSPSTGDLAISLRSRYLRHLFCLCVAILWAESHSRIRSACRNIVFERLKSDGLNPVHDGASHRKRLVLSDLQQMEGINVPRALCLMISLLWVSSINAATLPRDVLEAPRPIIKGPTYRYFLRDGHDSALCGHMLRVFNTKFAHLWDAEPIWAAEGDPVYSAQSVYAFPMLPHVKHDSESTFLLRYSKVPTSEEFRQFHGKKAGQ